MTMINCSVDTCSHNKKGECYANCIDIVGSSAKEDYDTACGAFLDKLHYSELTNNTLSEGACNCLKCSVETCRFNENNLCSLDEIQVSGRARDYIGTQCSSFKLNQ